MKKGEHGDNTTYSCKLLKAHHRLIGVLLDFMLLFMYESLQH